MGRSMSDMWSLHDIHERRPSCSVRVVSALPSARMRFHDITMTSITGEQVDFSDYEGTLVLVVNVASL